jgi:hypothetical protein
MVKLIEEEPPGDLEMMRRTREWPLVVLPLVKYSDRGSIPDTGLLYSPSSGPDEGKKFYFLPEGNLLDPFSTPLEKWPRTGGDELLVELVGAGWRVD